MGVIRKSSNSVSDDKLIHPPVFIAPIWQVATNDDGDLSGPVAGEKSQDMRAGAPSFAAEDQLVKVHVTLMPSLLSPGGLTGTSINIPNQGSPRDACRALETGTVI